LEISNTVNEVKRVLQPLAHASGITIRTEIASGIPPLQGDPSLIDGALTNLLSNAIKYSPRGSEVKLLIASSADMVLVEVWNPGPAIPPQDLEHLFEPYYRRPEQQDKIRGWGLGLAFVKRIVEQHGGRVEARSDPAVGTCFRIFLPVTRVVFSEALK